MHTFLVLNSQNVQRDATEGTALLLAATFWKSALKNAPNLQVFLSLCWNVAL